MVQYWLHRISHEWQVSYPLLKEGYLSIGFSDFANNKSLDFIEKNGIENAMLEEWGYILGNGDCFMNFVSSMKQGDYVVVPHYPERYQISIFRIIGENVIPVESYEQQIGIRNIKSQEILFDGKYLTINGKVIDLGFFLKVEPVIIGYDYSEIMNKHFQRTLLYPKTNLDITIRYKSLIDRIVSGVERNMKSLIILPNREVAKYVYSCFKLKDGTIRVVRRIDDCREIGEDKCQIVLVANEGDIDIYKIAQYAGENNFNILKWHCGFVLVDDIEDLKNVSNDCSHCYGECVCCCHRLIKELESSILTKKNGNGYLQFLTSGRISYPSPSVRNVTISEKIVHELNPNANDKELLIIDPYFYCKSNDNSHLEIFEDIMAKLGNINIIRIITSPESDNRAEIEKQAEVKRSFNEIATKYGKIIYEKYRTKEFHDRFWILINSMKGIVVGTSLNGLGKRVSLIAKLEQGDVDSVMSEVSQIEYKIKRGSSI